MVRSQKKFSILDGPLHLLNMVGRSRYLRPELLEVVDKVIKRNAYFAHPENILLAMLADENLLIRELALRRILKSRKESSRRELRTFDLQEVNLKATKYHELVFWSANIMEIHYYGKMFALKNSENS